MSELTQCPECGSQNLLHDFDSGEIVCRGCGLVLGQEEFAPPADRMPKAESHNLFAYTSFAVGTELASTQRTEMNVAQDVDRLLQKLMLPRSLQQVAINYMRKLRRLMREQKETKIRFSRMELTVVSVWYAIKVSNIPLSADEYVKKIQDIFNVKNLMKIEKRASIFVKVENRVPNADLVIGHINRIAAKLEDEADSVYVNKASSYAVLIVLANPGVITNRKANLVAASALLAADELLGKRLHLKAVAKAANTGIGSVAELVETCKKYAPPLPKESAALKFSSYLFREVNIDAKSSVRSD
ncbi:MAG: TFIIB-type zinc ribbon-containing protein [Candidatus Bathyarchaeia archaeon]|jgi:transcription initiation factor TFIIIB Brf1 subunit/transcription initiation factor TFIIB